MGEISASGCRMISTVLGVEDGYEATITKAKQRL
jgi:hypothetical protein